MDRIAKALAKLSGKEREWIKTILLKIKTGRLTGLDIKKLKGRDDIFRARQGDWRIIYRRQDKEIFILGIERRSEKTYKF